MAACNCFAKPTLTFRASKVPQLPANCTVEMILHSIVSAPWEKACYFRPLVAYLLVSFSNERLFLRSPRLLVDAGIQVVVPTLPALLSGASFNAEARMQGLCQHRPALIS